MSKDTDKALDVIGQKLRLKEEIDAPFDEHELSEEEITIAPADEDTSTSKISYKLSSKDIGFNALCQLNLGKAYIYRDGERKKYPANDKQAMNEKWLDFILEGIKNASNPVVVVTDIFTRVTTGNYDEVLPYREQLGYIYRKLNDPAIKDKIIILARGSIEQSIINNGGPDLMQKLGNMLGIPERVTNGGSLITATIKNSYTRETDSISFAHVDRKINTRTTLAKTMKKFSEEHPGYDVYYCTNAKQNWCGAGVTTYRDENGEVKEKTCWYISFGPMYEYDKFNLNRPEIGPYTLNKNWYKIFTDENSNVRMEFVNYIFPDKNKQDTSNYVASVVTDALTASYQDLIATIDANLGKFVEKDSKRARKEILSSIQTAKEKAKEEKLTPKKAPAKRAKKVAPKAEKPKTQDVQDETQSSQEGGEEWNQ